MFPSSWKKYPFPLSVESWHAYPYNTCRQVKISFLGMPQIAHFQVEKWKSLVASLPSQRLCPPPPNVLAHYATGQVRTRTKFKWLPWAPVTISKDWSSSTFLQPLKTCLAVGCHGSGCRKVSWSRQKVVTCRRLDVIISGRLEVFAAASNTNLLTTKLVGRRFSWCLIGRQIIGDRSRTGVRPVSDGQWLCLSKCLLGPLCIYELHAAYALQ